ncbi:hypothetical protein M378DRAFT_93200 [Amanita muscaria Koide BX008]|uniref:Uncharacterized protein n=1 Tax=Amanita muscaria (strain Koide BX008) TaxID=946122 RepID=A0A0C2WBW2_AMAMK|nr:hypothetical protein M378DRAFT_93207 [Amanita muscaria Koide BX008]KIL54063.1 hypothetical protein M378DRAFT_93200 [Amanita muscaria Koide BX008]
MQPPRRIRGTAYDLARVKAIRDVFWRCAGIHPGWWDWFGKADVPSALSKEMEEGKGQRTRGEGRTCSSESSASRRSC